MRGGEQGIFSARHVTSYGVNRNIFMSEDHPGTRFNFQVPQTFFLRAGKICHLLLGKFNILNILAA